MKFDVRSQSEAGPANPPEIGLCIGDARRTKTTCGTKCFNLPWGKREEKIS